MLFRVWVRASVRGGGEKVVRAYHSHPSLQALSLDRPCSCNLKERRGQSSVRKVEGGRREGRLGERIGIGIVRRTIKETA